MAVANGSGILENPFGNLGEIVQGKYDFSVDGGGTGEYEILVANEDVVVLDCYAVVTTTFTSGGSATIDLGIDSGGTEWGSAVAVASLVDGFVVSLGPGPQKVASGSAISVTIDTAAMTAGALTVFAVVAKHE